MRELWAADGHLRLDLVSRRAPGALKASRKLLSELVSMSGKDPKDEKANDVRSSSAADAISQSRPAGASGKTLSGVPLQTVYSSTDLDRWDTAISLGDPGEFPFTRGIYPTMYRGRPWTMRQYAGFGTAAQSNERYRYLLARGQSGLSVAFDLPTQMGYDSDHPSAAGEVGKVGVAICSLEDMETLFDGIPLGRVSTSMTINSTAAILLALYVAVAKKQCANLATLSGTVQNDILKEYIARGTYIYPPRPALRIITDLMAWCRTDLPTWTTISISGYHIREAGSTAAQEIAFTLADAIAYVDAAIAAGLGVDDFAPRLSFFFNAHSDLLEEIAKYRAARRLWAHVMRERFGARDPRSTMLRFHAQTAGSSLTAQQPENNMVRVAVQAMAAVLGGCQSLHTNALDEALALPTEEAALIALRTQQVLAQETGVANTVDPVGGAYAIERLTDELEGRARQMIERIDSLGGMLRAIETGYVQREIQKAAYDYQAAVERGDRIVVGVNRFQAEEQAPIPTLCIDPAIEREQAARVAAMRARRDSARAGAAIAAVEARARSGENLMPAIAAAVEAYATVGEISDAMRRVFGEYRESVTL
jgi:methylmalonyl-CoA mutase N-terminal domain/subunit